MQLKNRRSRGGAIRLLGPGFPKQIENIISHPLVASIFGTNHVRFQSFVAKNIGQAIKIDQNVLIFRDTLLEIRAA